MSQYEYHHLGNFGWKTGVHKAPDHYQHPWLVVAEYHTKGFWTREEARKYWKTVKSIFDFI
jgi:hypothetical protein